MGGMLATIALAMGASWCAGLNLYATLAVLGLMHRYVDGFTLPPELAVLGSHWVIWPAVFMYCVEFIADKVPAVDTAWDTVHTFIRVPAGAVLAAMALGDVPMELRIAAGIIGGTLAFGSHATKATTRVAAHTTGTSPLVSPAASVAEDGLVIASLGLLAAHPLLAIGVTALMMAGAVLLMILFWQIARRVLRGRGRLAAPADLPASA